MGAVAGDGVDQVQLGQFDPVVDDQRRLQFPDEDEVVGRVRNYGKQRSRRRRNRRMERRANTSHTRQSLLLTTSVETRTPTERNNSGRKK